MQPDEPPARDKLLFTPGKLTDVDCFRIGNIAHIFEADIRALLTAVRDVIDDMECSAVDG